MGELFALLIPVTIVWVAFSIAKLARTFHAFHQDYRRVHKLDDADHLDARVSEGWHESSK